MIQKSAFIILFFTLVFVTLLFYLVKQPSFQSLFVKPTPSSGPTPNEIYIPPKDGNNLPQLIDLAKKDLAEKLNIDGSKINVINTESKQWPDSSLGCPKPGFFYSQIVTAGYLITLKANGKTYDYHTNLEKVNLCN